MSTGIVSLLFLVLFSGTAIAGEIEALAKGRDAAASLNRAVRERLEAVAKSSDPTSGFGVCSYQAQALTDEVEKRMGVRLKRTSLKVRNPANAPDDFEKSVLDRFESVVRAGALPEDAFEEGTFEGKKVYRYAQPILVGNFCLVCHGVAGEISADVRRVLAERYPEDKATGYRSGDLRGIVSVVIPAN